MEKNNISKKQVIFTIAWLTLMMFLSHQPGPDTAKTSGWLAVMIADFLSLDEMIIHNVIRHSAHAVLYMVLTISSILVFSKTKIKMYYVLALLLMISLLDEGTKPFIVGRHCDIEDIALNDLGVIIGYFFMNMWCKYR